MIVCWCMLIPSAGICHMKENNCSESAFLLSNSSSFHTMSMLDNLQARQSQVREKNALPVYFNFQVVPKPYVSHSPQLCVFL